jgi:hypothetical protein
MRKLTICLALLLGLASVAHAQVPFPGWGVVKAVAACTNETIGNESNFASGTGPSSSSMHCYKMEEAPSANGTVQSISAHLWTVGVHIKFALYSHDAGNNLPDSLITNSVTDALTQSAAYPGTLETATYSGTKPTVTSGTQYWLCFQGDADTGTWYEDATGVARRCSKTNTYDNWPSWGGSANWCGDSRFGKLYYINCK